MAKCPLCKSEDMFLITNKVRFGKEADVYRCNDCSLVFLDQDSFEFPKDFYEKEYHQTYLTHVEPDALDPEKYFEKASKTTKKWADKFLYQFPHCMEATVLDVGCSTGHFMCQIKPKVRAVIGVELNEKELKFCKEEKKLEVYNVIKTVLANKHFITMIYVLEHIADPVTFLKDCRKKLIVPNGRIVLLVPCINDALLWLYKIPEYKEFHFCIEHLYYFNKKTLNLVLEQAGFNDIQIEMLQEYPLTNHLKWLYQRAPGGLLESREGEPPIHPSMFLDTTDVETAWTQLWARFNIDYKHFLWRFGYGDRLWATASYA